jgi:hypothetical protein
VEVELASVGEEEGGEGGHGLGGGVDVDDGVAFPGSGAVAIGVTGPEVDDRLALEDYGD